MMEPITLTGSFCLSEVLPEPFQIELHLLAEAGSGEQDAVCFNLGPDAQLVLTGTARAAADAMVINVVGVCDPDLSAANVLLLG